MLDLNVFGKVIIALGVGYLILFAIAASSGEMSASGPPISVLTQPGWTEETVIPEGFNLKASVLVYILSAALEIL